MLRIAFVWISTGYATADFFRVIERLQKWVPFELHVGSSQCLIPGFNG
jgi:hypothetical protein